jgi:hypothetical protein
MSSVTYRPVHAQSNVPNTRPLGIGCPKIGAVPQQQQRAPELPQTSLSPSPFSFFGKVCALKGSNANYRNTARNGKSLLLHFAVLCFGKKMPS